jgi:8-oxo-dGTP pyrophosphatase MutT (NUDIX family)
MHDGELWQVFAENGQPIKGKGAPDDAFDRDASLLMGNAHVWLWKHGANGIEVLLQRRSMTKKRRPGYYHISAGGHINVGENPVDTAVRETKEELGLSLDPSKLYLAHIVRMPSKWRDFAHVYTYELSGNEEFSFDDGEVGAVEWKVIDAFHGMTKDPDANTLVDSGGSYFEALITTLRRNEANEDHGNNGPN